MANNLADGDRAELAWKLDHFAEELTRLRGILRGRGRRAFADACRMFVDRHKYRIADADRKSRLRRTVERLLKRTGEIRELSALMKGGSGHGARWAIPASK